MILYLWLCFLQVFYLKVQFIRICNQCKLGYLCNMV
uniref:Uncharacterized protein n=1 Tax=Arundo donax TaxID=35708 RepID=A0A0A9H1D2_ARUDO